MIGLEGGEKGLIMLGLLSCFRRCGLSFSFRIFRPTKTHDAGQGSTDPPMLMWLHFCPCLCFGAGVHASVSCICGSWFLDSDSIACCNYCSPTSHPHLNCVCSLGTEPLLERTNGGVLRAYDPWSSPHPSEVLPQSLALQWSAARLPTPVL